MRWTFKGKELSPGHYWYEATREDGRSISRDGDHDVIAETIREAYIAELVLGTHEVEAAYEVTRGFLSAWPAGREVSNPDFWAVAGPFDKCVIYNAEMMRLIVERSAAERAWEGRISELAKPNCDYFRELVRL